MKLKKRESLNHVFHAAMLPTAIFSVGLTMPASIAHATIATPDEVIVTARRTEEVLQNVPISMTVFNQDMLTERNVTSGADLATYTPSLSVNTRFGGDQATFAIRGFTQELRTTASVAVYFADVVAPRGGGSISAGDGAGPGAFFDLQNVQVLKGPQGTLFGRNTTGGAIQLVPQEPTTKFEGYAELSDGNYNMHRYQGVINVPISDSVRARFGVDRQTRDGYLNNISGIGPDRLADVNYTAGRASLMWDITDTLRNYTIYTYTYSRNRGSINGIFQCEQGGLVGFICGPSYDQWQQAGANFYDVINDTPDPISMIRQWQLINTTTWDINDDVTLKNILSLAHLTQTTRGSIFGVNASSTVDGQHLWFLPAGTVHGIPVNNQKTVVEELQLQGSGLDGGLTWQAGLYFENSRPDGISGSLAPTVASCSTPGDDARDFRCTNIIQGLFSSMGTIEYKNLAAYTQSTYDISDEFRVTLGLRYTVDKTNGESQQQSLTFDRNPFLNDGSTPNPSYGQPTGFNCIAAGGDITDQCSFKMHQRSEAPTWSIGLDYLPNPDVMVYTKYSRGYRQGAVSIFAPDGLQEFKPEKVDAYEIGAKTTFRAPVPGTFNVSAFYNELSNQQLQANYTPCGLTFGCQPGEAGHPATTAILNAGKSKIQGVEVETTLKLLQDLIFNMSYTYLTTRLDSLTPTPPASGYAAGANNVIGEHLSFSPTHSLTTGLSYNLPVPADLGDVSVGGSYTFVSDQLSCSSGFGQDCRLPSRRLVSLNANWKAIAKSPFDASLFMTNALNEKVTSYVPGLMRDAGSEYRVVGEPRMWGVKLKYSFGE